MTQFANGLIAMNPRAQTRSPAARYRLYQCGAKIKNRNYIKKFCSKDCRRLHYAERFDRWVANPETLALPQCYDEFLMQEELPCLIDGCEWKGKHLARTATRSRYPGRGPQETRRVQQDDRAVYAGHPGNDVRTHAGLRLRSGKTGSKSFPVGISFVAASQIMLRPWKTSEHLVKSPGARQGDGRTQAGYRLPDLWRACQAAPWASRSTVQEVPLCRVQPSQPGAGRNDVRAIAGPSSWATRPRCSAFAAG